MHIRGRGELYVVDLNWGLGPRLKFVPPPPPPTHTHTCCTVTICKLPGAMITMPLGHFQPAPIKQVPMHIHTVSV